MKSKYYDFWCTFYRAGYIPLEKLKEATDKGIITGEEYSEIINNVNILQASREGIITSFYFAYF